MSIFGDGYQMSGRSKMRALALYLFAVSSAAFVAESAHAEQNAKWDAWLETGGYLSSERDRGELVAYAPLWQDDNSLIFTDIRGKFFSDNAQEANLAVGYRELTDDWIYGAWVGYDLRRSDNDHIFRQASVGLEVLGVDHDFRVNGYLPVSDARNSAQGSNIIFSGNQIFLTGGREVPLGGFDAEVGYRLPIEDWFAQTQGQQFWLHAGGFFFSADEAPENQVGPKLRATWRLSNLAGMPEGSRLAFETEYQHDRMRDNQLEVGFRLRIPLSGWGDTKRPRPLSPLERRMVEGLERDTDIVVGRSGREQVADAATGTLLSAVVQADARDNLQAITAGVGADKLILVDGTAGPVNGSATLTASQTLASGGTALRVRGVRSGVEVNAHLPGSKATLVPTCACDDIVSIRGDNVHVTGFLLDGKGASNDGINIDSGRVNFALTGLTIQDTGNSGILGWDNNQGIIRHVAIQRAAADGINFDTNNQLVIRDVRINDAGFFGLGVNRRNTLSVDRLNIDGSFAPAILMVNDNHLSLTNSTIINAGASNIEIMDRNTVIIENTTMTNSGDEGINMNDNNVISFINSRLDGATDDGFDIGTGNVLTIAGSTFSGVFGDDLFDFDGVGNQLTQGSTGNTNAGAIIGDRLCNAPGAGAFTGTIGFEGGLALLDNQPPCN